MQSINIRILLEERKSLERISDLMCMDVPIPMGFVSNPRRQKLQEKSGELLHSQIKPLSLLNDKSVK